MHDPDAPTGGAGWWHWIVYNIPATAGAIAQGAGTAGHLNMSVPIDLLKPVLDDLMTMGRPNHPPRPWLGLYATEVEDKLVIAGLAKSGPAARANLRVGDMVLAVAGTKVDSLGGLFRQIWSVGQAGVEVPFTIYRDGRTFEAKVTSADRSRLLKGPSLH